MYFSVTAHDIPGEAGVALRDELRPLHAESISELFRAGVVLFGAGVYDDAGVVRGSLIIMDRPSRSEVIAYLDSEPFHAGGLWERVEISELKVPEMYLAGLGTSSRD